MSARPSLVAGRDYWYLCLACGSAERAENWTCWHRPLTDDWKPDEWVPALPGEGDPMMRCPACGWEHVDDDSNPGIFDGTQAQVEAHRAQEEPEYGEWWAERLAEVAGA